MFEDNEKQIHLTEAIDKMRERFGDRAIMSAAGLEAKSISRWNPFNGEPPPLLPNRRR
ncbi:DNA polymerase IV [Algibacter lectus]|uniref:DNA polymerase IV n=1 Tax=Algibacter lectus TaxID=221126 RepID=A0A090V9D7_9FLAO|nr:DNA polymerase IV [Algibacter lectus]